MIESVTLVPGSLLSVQPYGVLILLGFLTALWYCMGLARRSVVGRAPAAACCSITPDHVFNLAWAGLFTGTIGAHLLFVMLNAAAFRERPGDALMVGRAGLCFIGAPLLNSALLWIYCHYRRLSFLRFADLFAPGCAIGYVFARVGCFLGGCCYGHACDLPWAMRFPQGGAWTLPSHPTQLYAAACGLLIFFLLDRWSRRRLREGELFFRYVALYCTYRFLVEFLRVGATAQPWVLGLTHAQVACSLAFVVALLLLVLRRERQSEATISWSPAVDSQ